MVNEVKRSVIPALLLLAVAGCGVYTASSGRVVRYTLREVAARQDLTVNEYQVQLAVVLTFTVRDTGATIFKDRRFTGSGNYVLDDPQGTTEQTARAEAVKEIVRDILAQVVEDW